MEAETFYRWHHNDAPTFDADHAWSGLWGSEFNADGSKTKCMTCDGDGEDWRDCPRCHGDIDAMPDCDRCEGNGAINECGDCDATGWIDCVRGFSSCRTAEELYGYFTDRARSGVAADGLGTVIVFEGEQTGTGFDDEPCVVPTRVLKEMTWTEFTATIT
ncbi:hypothetical protein ACFVH6_21710 [Spirillospora sp. NPDC127200]